MYQAVESFTKRARRSRGEEIKEFLAHFVVLRKGSTIVNCGGLSVDNSDKRRKEEVRWLTLTTDHYDQINIITYRTINQTLTRYHVRKR